MGRTIQLDDDVAARLDAESRRSGAPLNNVANDALRRALSEVEEPRSSPTKFVVRPIAMGPLLIDISCTSRALAELDRLEEAERRRS